MTATTASMAKWNCSLTVAVLLFVGFAGCVDPGLPLASSERVPSESIVPVHEGEQSGASSDRVLKGGNSSDASSRPSAEEATGNLVLPIGVSDLPSPDRIANFLATFPAAALELQRWDTTGADAWVRSRLASMSIDEKLGQLIIVRLARGRDDKQPLKRDEDAVVNDAVGGFIVSRLLPPEWVADEVTRLQKIAKTPLFFSADYERGVGRFSNNFTELPSNMAIGATRDTVASALSGILTAIESRAIGVNLLFAPVVDVNNNPANPIINIRSYGEDPDLVARLSASYVRGAESFGVLTTVKHFPGHGNSSIDTHAHMDIVRGSLAELKAVELLPYDRLFASDAAPSAIMMAHLGVEAFDKDKQIPSTLSSNVTGYLRSIAGPDALIITDDVRMGALQNDYSLAERVVGPIKAGADIILTPEAVQPAIQALKSALKSGRITEARIDDSVRRILKSKAKIGLHSNPGPSTELVADLSATPFGQAIADSIAVESITYYKGVFDGRLDGQLPGSTTLVQMSNFSGSESIDRAMLEFADALEIGPENELRLSRAPDAGTTSWLREQRSDSPVVVALHLRLRSGRGSAGLADGHAEVMNAVFELNRPTTVVLFGNPYVAADVDRAQTILVAYDQTVASVRAAANVLSGRALPSGTLPVTVVR